MCSISTYVNSRGHHRRGQLPKHNRVLQAFVGAHLLRERLLGVDSVTRAAVATGTTRAAVHAALIVLQNGDDDLAASVLKGREPLSRAEVMRDAYTNQPTGRRYEKAMAEWLIANGFKEIDKGIRSRLLECHGLRTVSGFSSTIRIQF